MVSPLLVGGGSSSHTVSSFDEQTPRSTTSERNFERRGRPETAAYPSVRDNRVVHQASQRIVGLGPRVVPLIIEQLRRDVDHWFWALAMIVGHDAAPAARTVDEAAKGWVEWTAGNWAHGLSPAAALEKLFPNLASAGYEITSAEDPRYNCIAWAARQHHEVVGARCLSRLRVLLRGYYWPDGVDTAVTLPNYVRVMRRQGFRE